MTASVRRAVAILLVGVGGHALALDGAHARDLGRAQVAADRTGRCHLASDGLEKSAPPSCIEQLGAMRLQWEGVHGPEAGLMWG